MTPRVGYIGLGRMGSRMAANVLAGGFPLTVYDLRAEPVQELAYFGLRNQSGKIDRTFGARKYSPVYRQAVAAEGEGAATEPVV